MLVWILLGRLSNLDERADHLLSGDKAKQLARADIVALRKYQHFITQDRQRLAYDNYLSGCEHTFRRVFGEAP